MLKIINEKITFKVSDNFEETVEYFDDIPVLVVDNFYQNPDEVRNLAMTIPATWYTNREGFPACQVKANYDLRGLIKPYNYLITKYFPMDNAVSNDFSSFAEYVEINLRQASFLVNVMQSDGNEYLQPHVDNPNGVNLASGIFLNTPEECSGGTSFFKNDKYLGYVEMKYNRMIMYRQNVQHTARMEFNSFVGDRYRINQMFFI